MILLTSKHYHNLVSFSVISCPAQTVAPPGVWRANMTAEPDWLSAVTVQCWLNWRDCQCHHSRSTQSVGTNGNHRRRKTSLKILKRVKNFEKFTNMIKTFCKIGGPYISTSTDCNTVMAQYTDGTVPTTTISGWMFF